MDKVKRYKWARPGDKGRFQKIQLSDLKIDPSYQRSEVSARNTLRIARDFDWTAFGALLVMQRVDKSYYVVDGHQRVLAAKHRGDIKAVPAIMFQSLGPMCESAAFVAANVNRTFVKAFNKYRANVLSGQSPEREIDLWLRSVGMSAVSKARQPMEVQFVHVLARSWSRDKEHCKRALLAQCQIYVTEVMDACTQKGICWLLRKGVTIEDHLDTLKPMGKAAILARMRAIGIEQGTTLSERTCGLGILDAINKRLRTRKIRIKGM